ncbi:hypothetical protein NHG28_04655 [Aerococcaceae bacterium NML201209]|nr:hypothetical protein [Aerococcaceae bacterium NML201209]MCW6667344.1 hypothetical protein [Aerococcaceae bacterium NML190938]
MIIGIDGGGTKTKFCLYCADGTLVDAITRPSCHFMQVSELQMYDILSEGIHTLLSQCSSSTDVFVCAGLGGYGKNQEIRQRIEAVFAKILPNRNFYLCSDAEIAAAGALGGENGVVIISGTGSIVLSKEQNTFYRAGGWGYLIGDEGSSFWIGRTALSVFSKQADGRLPKSILYESIKTFFALDDDYQLISSIYHLEDYRGTVAQLARIVCDCAESGDEQSLSIIDQAARELAAMVKAVPSTSKKVSYVGGLFNAQHIILGCLSKYLGEGYMLVPPIAPPEKGAYYLAKEVIS